MNIRERAALLRGAKQRRQADEKRRKDYQTRMDTLHPRPDFWSHVGAVLGALLLGLVLALVLHAFHIA